MSNQQHGESKRERGRWQFSLRTLLIVCIWGTVVVNLTLTMPAVALVLVGIPLGILAVKAARRGRLLLAFLFFALIAYFAFLLVGIPLLEGRQW